jgi:uncharacterized protein
MPVLHSRYLNFIYGNPTMRAYRQRDPRLQERHFHRYINLHWSRRERLRHLLGHYKFISAVLPEPLFHAIYVRGSAYVGFIAMKDGSMLKLSLMPPISMGREGELCIALSLDDQPIYRLVFTVVDAGATLVIGCLQGPGAENSRNVVRNLTRNLHGLRPKQLILGLVYAFARQFSIKNIRAVGNAAHPLRRKGHKFMADYDEFWQEQLAVAEPQDWYRLPNNVHRKTEAEVPSNHRSAFRRREDLRVKAEDVLLDALTGRRFQGSLANR